MEPAGHTLLVDLAHLSGRVSVAAALAKVLGCEELVFFLWDEAVRTMVPAPGMPKTFAGGPLWREFVRTITADGRHVARVDQPLAAPREALALTRDGVAAVLLGGAPGAQGVDELASHLPLLGALFKTEHQLALGRVEVAEARLAADRAHALVKALDAARASAAGLNDQLRREHAQKDEFLAMLAHELRNPLAPLVNSLAILNRAPQGTPVARRQLEVMGRQVNQLTRLVDDLLDVSRVSRGLIELRREHLPLAEVLDTAVEAARPVIEAKQHKLQRFGEQELLYVSGDRVRLTQVFANLLQNAAKYTDAGGLISLGVVSDSGRASVIVRDTGVGIPRDMLSRVFDLFEQVPVSLDRSQGGLGIGLTLVRTLTELHGGIVTAHSVGMGQGSTFTVTLPLLPAPVAAMPPAGPRELYACDARVLVVDDNADAAESMAEMLRLIGAQTRVARDGLQAIEIAQSFAPDLVLLDIGLPGMDGYEVAGRLRKLPGLKLRLVALTGYGSAKDRERSREAGFDEHLVKPVAFEAIEGVLRSLGFTGERAAT